MINTPPVDINYSPGAETSFYRQSVKRPDPGFHYFSVTSPVTPSFGKCNFTLLGDNHITCVRMSDLGIRGGRTRAYFLTSECSGCFRYAYRYSYVLTSGLVGGWSSGSQTFLTSCHGNLWFWYFLFRSRFCFRFKLCFRNYANSSAFPCA